MAASRARRNGDARACTVAIGELSRRRQWGEALAALGEVRNDGGDINAWISTATLGACGRGGRWDLAFAMLGRMVGFRAQPEVTTYNVLTSCVEKCHRWPQALAVANALPCKAMLPDRVSYNAVVTALGSAARLGDVRWVSALATLRRARMASLQLTLVHYSVSVSACGDGQQHVKAMALMDAMQKDRLETDTILYTAAMTACEQGQQWTEALSLLQRAEHRNVELEVITFTANVAAAAKSVQWRGAIAIFAAAQCGLKLDVIICNAALFALERALQWHRALEFVFLMHHGYAEPTVATYNIESSALSSSGSWERSLGILKRMQANSLRMHCDSYSAMIQRAAGMVDQTGTKSSRGLWHWTQPLACFDRISIDGASPDAKSAGTVVQTVQKGQQWEAAFFALEAMTRTKLELDPVSHGALLSSSAYTSTWQRMCDKLLSLQVKAIDLQIHVCNAGISACEKDPQWNAALVLLRMATRLRHRLDAISYNAIVSSSEKCEEWRHAMDAVLQMSSVRIPTDEISCGAALSACEACGRWERAWELFQDFASRHFEPAAYAFNILVSAAEKGLQWMLALASFLERASHSVERDAIACNAAMLACSECRQWQHAVEFMDVAADGRLEPSLRCRTVMLMEFEQQGLMVHDVRW